MPYAIRFRTRNQPLSQRPAVSNLQMPVHPLEELLEAITCRRVKALINAAPIHAQDGVVESFVVILQDMTPPEE